jgi:hypothetical protein
MHPAFLCDLTFCAASARIDKPRRVLRSAFFYYLFTLRDGAKEATNPLLGEPLLRYWCTRHIAGIRCIYGFLYEYLHHRLHRLLVVRIVSAYQQPDTDKEGQALSARAKA